MSCGALRKSHGCFGGHHGRRSLCDGRFLHRRRCGMRRRLRRCVAVTIELLDPIPEQIECGLELDAGVDGR
ncbi:hypothetical protein ACVWZ3_005460 [Bradyrhizobium sp. i1.3.6]